MLKLEDIKVGDKLKVIRGTENENLLPLNEVAEVVLVIFAARDHSSIKNDGKLVQGLVVALPRLKRLLPIVWDVNRFAKTGLLGVVRNSNWRN
jgi:hypothetical protein